MNDITGKRLLILGGMRIHSEIVKNVQARGGKAIVIDYFDDFQNSPTKAIADEHYVVSTTDVDAVCQFIKDKNIDYFINVNGEWIIGGPISDCGLTGRKIVVDQYGGYCNVGGGAFSGKDMSKVDRSGAYMCRYLAKNIVDAGLADEAKVELSYIISEPQPCAIKVELKNAHQTPIVNLDRQIEKYIKENIDLTPKGIIDRFFPCGISPIFYNTARNGHFGYNDNTA